MGGRGSAGAANSGGGLKFPAMAGSEKQVQYAKDIIRRPLDNLDLQIKKAEETHERYIRDGLESAAKLMKAETEAYKSAKREYERTLSEDLSKEAAYYGGEIPRQTVSRFIDAGRGTRGAFQQRMNEIIREELRKKFKGLKGSPLYYSI